MVTVPRISEPRDAVIEQIGWSDRNDQRFWSKVDRTGECWVWTGTAAEGGYGHFKISGTTLSAMAHRVAYRVLVGPIPDGLQLDHLCRNPPCVNPAHLEPVTARENIRRAMEAKYGGPNRSECTKGHPWTPENIYWRKSGHPVCRACNRERQRNAWVEGWRPPEYPAAGRARRQARAKPRQQRPACPQGHEFTPENTFYGSDGRRRCRACRRAKREAARAARAALNGETDG